MNNWKFLLSTQSIKATSCRQGSLWCYLISSNYNRFHCVLFCKPTYPAAKVLPPACFRIPLVIFCSTIFSLHKQCLQSESCLIKGTNLSRSNQVAALASAADNSRLFDQKYIILGRLPACLDGFVWGQEIGEVIAPFWCSSPQLSFFFFGKQDESYPSYKWKYPQWTELSFLDTARATSPRIIPKSLYSVCA